MKKITLLASLLLFTVFFIYGQKDDAADAQAKVRENFIEFDLNLAPNTNGALEGSASLGLLWSPWLETRTTFSVSSFSTVYSQNVGSITTIESNKNLDIDIIRTRNNFLRLNFGRSGYYGALNISLLLNTAWLEQESYGYGTVPIEYTFFSNQTMFLLYPFGNGEVEIGLGPFRLNGYFKQSILPLYTKVEGDFFYSMIGSSIDFSTEDKGSETRFGGTATFQPFESLLFTYNFNYRRHTGNTYGYIVGVGTAPFEYELIEMTHTGLVSFEIFGYKPVLGISYVSYTFNPVILHLINGYTNSRFNFILGLSYK